MVTQIPIPATYEYKEVGIGRYKGTREFKLINIENEIYQFPDRITLCRNRKIDKFSPDYLLNGTDESDGGMGIVELYKTNIKYIRVGSHFESHDLIICLFSNNSEYLTLDLFTDCHIGDLSVVLPLFN